MAEEPKPNVLVPEESNPARKRPKPPVKIQPPLMPLIDVMFTLMIFFLVVCQFRQKEGALPTALPTFGGQAVSAAKELRSIHVKVFALSAQDQPENREPRFVVDLAGGSGVQSQEELYGLLEKVRDKIGSTEPPVIIEAADDGVPWEFVVQAFNQVLRVKFKNVAFGSIE